MDVLLGCSQFRGRFATSELTHRPTRNTTGCFNSLKLTAGEKSLLSRRLKIDCPCYFLLVLSADLGNPLFIFEIIYCLSSIWFYIPWMYSVQRSLCNWWTDTLAHKVCNQLLYWFVVVGAFMERTEDVLGKVTLLSKELIIVIIFLYSLHVDL